MLSIVPTKRRRFLWAAWWTAPPEAEPFRKPDGSNGGAHSRDEARAEAERAAGQKLVEIDARWAGAWVRVLRGDTPWPKPREKVGAREEGASGGEQRGARDEGASRASSAPPPPTGSKPWALSVLGLAAGAEPADIKRAFRALALRTHPDKGGEAATFVAVKRAYDVALAAATSPRKRRAR